MEHKAAFVQISDFHLERAGSRAYGGADAGAYVANCLKAVNELSAPVQFVVVTGDLAESGLVEEYQYARELLSGLSLPYYVIPGNHDRREPFLQEFRGEACPVTDGQFAQYDFQWGKYHCIAIDTLAEGTNGGELCSSRLEWLETRLRREAGKPRVIFMHHPPIQTGIAFMDSIRLKQAAADALEKLLARYPAETHIVCGHVHRAISTVWAGASLHICPGIMHHISFSLSEKPEASYCFEPPAFNVFAETAHGLVSHAVHVERYGPKHSFADG